MVGLSNLRVSNRDAPGIFLTVEPEGQPESIVDVSEVVISMEFTDSESKADTLSLALDNFNGEFWDEATFAKNNLIRMQFGYPGFLSPRREFVIEKATGGRVMNVEAKARSVLLARERKCLVYENMSVADVVAEIAAQAGFGRDSQFIERTPETTRVVDIINQPSMTDAEFLNYLAHQRGFEFYIDFQGFHWHPRRFEDAPVRTLTWYGGGNEGQNSILNYNVENDLTAKPAKTMMKGKNPRTKKPISEEGSNSETARPVLQEVVEIIDPETGEFVQATKIGSSEVLPTPEDSEEKAKARADGRYRKVQQTAVKLSLDVVGDPLLLAKTVAQVEKLGKRLSGRYYISEVKHTIGNGYQMSVSAITDGTKGHIGVSTNDALFPPTETQRGQPNVGGLVRILQGTAERLRTAQTAKQLVGEGTSALELARRLGVVADGLKSDATDQALYDQARSLGQQVQGLGRRAGNKGVERSGRSLISAAERGKNRAKAAKAKGELNEKPVKEQEEKPRLEEVPNLEDNSWTLRRPLS